MAKTATLTPAPTQTVVADQTLFDAGPQVNVQGFDPVDTLPAAAAEKLQKLRLRADDLHKVAPGFEQVQELSLERVKAERELKRLTDSPHDDGFNLPASDSRVIAAQRRLDKLTDDHKRVKELSEVRSQAWRVAGSTLQAVEGWLRNGQPPGTTLQDWDGPEPKFAKGENGLLDAIENRRRRVRELKASLHTVRSAPFPASLAKQRLREQVSVLAQRCEPCVSSLIEHADGMLEFPRVLARAQVRNVPNAPAAAAYFELVDPVALVAWLLKDQLIAALDREIDSEADDKAALSPEIRQQREAEVMGDLLAVERDECALVWQAQAQNLPVEHRSDISPLALLGVRLVTAPRVVPTMGTSPQHAVSVVGT